MSLVRISQRSRHHAPHRMLARGIRTQPAHENVSFDQHTVLNPPGLGLATPRQLVQYLDQFVVGQENAKKVLSVAVFNHYNRIRANMIPQDSTMTGSDSVYDQEPRVVSQAHVRPMRRHPPTTQSLLAQPSFPLVEKSNVLMIGPTGSGKTFLCRTLAKILDVPFSVSDATSFTQAGYVGEDVDMAIQRLLQEAHGDTARASTGIVYIDEVDKIAKKAGSSMEGSRDVSGEGVQQALLRMMEGSVVNVQSKDTHPDTPPPGAPGGKSGRSDPRGIDTSNVLFILSGAFVGLDTIIKQRVSKSSIGFSSSEPAVKESMPFFTPNKKGTPNALDLVETGDLVKYGFIPEFISRLPSITTLAPLTMSDLRRILTEVKGSLVSQYQSLFGYSGVDIRFTSAALDEICRQAMEKGGGARGLRGIMESVLLEPMYEVPGSDIGFVLITEDVVRKQTPPQYWPKGDPANFAFMQTWLAENKRYQRQLVERTSSLNSN